LGALVSEHLDVTHLLYRCYAKLNLTLEVLRRREDGYHDLTSLVHTISLADDLRIDSAEQLLTRVEGLDIDAETNLVSRAAELLQSTTRVGVGAELTLKKGIPAAAGLGGGSSDAATTLVGLNALWGTRVGLADLTQLAASLGSDVPFFVRGGAALMEGRGEQLRALPPMTGQWFVIVVPPHDVLDKTRRLYAALEPTDFSSGAATATAAGRLSQHLPLSEDQLTNTFFRAACAVFPGLSALHVQAEQMCGRRFFLSGAGPALFAFAADRTDARRQQARFARLGIPADSARAVKHARATTRFATDSVIGYP
jgi:4-diphosphocytidyl-2-C-methyl-D-erythritol kinase